MVLLDGIRVSAEPHSFLKVQETVCVLAYSSCWEDTVPSGCGARSLFPCWSSSVAISAPRGHLFFLAVAAFFHLHSQQPWVQALSRHVPLPLSIVAPLWSTLLPSSSTCRAPVISVVPPGTPRITPCLKCQS